MRRLVAAAVLLAACGGEPDSRHPGVEAFQAPPPSALTVCAAGPTVEGIDVSHYDGTINWTLVKGSGRVFGISKATEGLTYTDPMFATNWAAMKNAGLVRGGYHFFRPLDSGTQQADFFLSKVSDFAEGDLPPILDLEVTDPSVSSALEVQRVQDFVDEIKARTGLTTILYSSARFLALIGNPTQFANLPLWDARWGVTCPNIPDAWETWVFWQYSATATVPGIAGDGGVDVNQFNGTLNQLVAMTGPGAADAGADAGTPADAGADDAGTAEDAGAADDAGADAGAGDPDGGVPAADAGDADAGTADAGAADAGPADAGDGGEGNIIATTAIGCGSSGGAGAGTLALLLLVTFFRKRRWSLAPGLPPR